MYSRNNKKRGVAHNMRTPFQYADQFSPLLNTEVPRSLQSYYINSALLQFCI